MQLSEKKVLITADDALMHPHIDAAILSLLRQEFCPLTNVSFAVEGTNVAVAHEYATAARQEVSYGLHLVLPTRNFDQKRGMLPLLHTSHKKIHNEIKRQYDLFCGLFGYPPAHVDSHFGSHQIFPHVLIPVLQLAREYNMLVRSFSGVSANMQIAGRRYRDTSPESIIYAFKKIRPGMPEEIIFHPAYNCSGDENSRLEKGYGEFKALSDPKLSQRIRDIPHLELVSWKDLYASLKKR